jgi:hypothetical protein
MPQAATSTMKLPPYRLARVADLIPHATNARTHSAEQVAMLARMITEYGWTNPVLVDGKRGIIAGHGRVMAAQSLGMEQVPTIELRHLSAAQKRAYIIADNQSALTAGWDRDLLALEMLELRDDGFDLSLTGFDAGEIGKLLGDDDGQGGAGSGAGSLAAQFGIPPFSVLNAREGWWQDRKRAWIALGIQSELGRGENTLGLSAEAEDYRRNRGEYVKPANATPGGAPMPAADYSQRQRGDGRGRAIG